MNHIVSAFAPRFWVRVFCVLLGTIWLPHSAPGQDSYYSGRLHAFDLEKLTLDQVEPDPFTIGPGLEQAPWTEPWVVLSCPGEAYVHARMRTETNARPRVVRDVFLALRTPAGAVPSGRVYLVRPDRSGFDGYRFTLRPSMKPDASSQAFLETKAAYCSGRALADLPGSAWFRHQADDAWRELEPFSGWASDPNALSRSRSDYLSNRSPLEDSFEVFSGGRALAENLPLDRNLNPSEPDGRVVSIGSIIGIDVEEMDWAAPIRDLDPQLDALASWIPYDQHGVFFPSLQALDAVLDEATRVGTPVLRILDPRSEDARTRERYERQLCVPIKALNDALGSDVVEGVALTGSDPYLRTGSDVALLFQCNDPAVLYAYLQQQQSEALMDYAGAAAVPGVENGLPYLGVRTAHRQVCTYLARKGEVIIVTNSLAQLKRLAGTSRGDIHALESSPEFIFFRDRYPLGQESEAAFLLLTDATIRRWANPRWKIGASRRTRAAALLSDDQAGKILSGNDQVIASPEFGTLAFLTPILELNLNTVAAAEASAYGRFRNRYQRRWDEYFDPIAASFEVGSEGLALDVSVMPLIARTDYADWIDLTAGASLEPLALKFPPEALFRWAVALNPESNSIKRFGRWTSVFVPDLNTDPLAWIGPAMGSYAEDDPFWQEWSDSETPSEFLNENFHRFPLAFFVEVQNPLGLAAFLSGLRAFVTTSAPGLLQWETVTYKERTYVRISVVPGMMGGGASSPLEQLALHYIIQPGRLTLSLRGEVIERAIDRALAPPSDHPDSPAQPEILGDSIAVHFDGRALRHPIFWDSGKQDVASWNNLAILNEWHRLFPDRNPVEVHEELWNTRLLCAGGGEYLWNEEWQTMESTVYGHPGNPREGPIFPLALNDLASGDFGLTLEENGLRARVFLRRVAGDPVIRR